ncbi:MAG: hypothetical protein AAFO07_03000 [Bacteroidota bacterium]
MSRFFVYITILQIAFASLAIANNAIAQSLSETKVFCEWKKVKLEKAFADIQNQSDFFFSYSSVLIM